MGWQDQLTLERRKCPRSVCSPGHGAQDICPNASEPTSMQITGNPKTLSMPPRCFYTSASQRSFLPAAGGGAAPSAAPPLPAQAPPMEGWRIPKRPLRGMLLLLPWKGEGTPTRASATSAGFSPALRRAAAGSFPSSAQPTWFCTRAAGLHNSRLVPGLRSPLALQRRER